MPIPGVDPRTVQAAWSIPAPWQLRPADRGLNNRSYFVDTPSRTYVLRLYDADAALGRIRHEHALLAALRRAPLSFAVPAPVPTQSGETLALLPDGGGEVRAALFPLIPGRHPDPGSAPQADAAGEALAELDLALAGIDVAWAKGAEAPVGYGAISRIHPAVPDPLRLPAQLAGVLDAERREHLARVLVDVVQSIPALDGTLPRQLIHGDYGKGNTLIDASGSIRVTGILDFEFATADIRAMDWAVGLYHYAAFGSGPLDGVPAWALLDAFGAGYARRLRLADAEVAALPAQLRLLQAVRAVHWGGRFLQRVTSRERMLGVIEDLLQLDAWLSIHDRRLVERAGAWQRGDA